MSDRPTLSRRASIEAASNKSAELRAKASAAKAAQTKLEKQSEQDRLKKLQQERLAHAKQIIQQRKLEHAANAPHKPTVSRSSGGITKYNTVQSVVAAAVREGAELVQSIKPIDATSVNVKQPNKTKSLELRKSVAEQKAAITKTEKQAEQERLERLKQERLNHAKAIIQQRKTEHAANAVQKPTVSKAAPIKWKAQSVVAQSVKEGEQLIQHVKPIDANRVDVKQPKPTKALELRKSVGNTKAAETKTIKQLEAERLEKLRQEELNKAKEIIATRKAEHAANAPIKPQVSEAKPVKWNVQSVIAKDIQEGQELAANIRPIRGSRDSSRRNTLDKNSSVNSSRRNTLNNNNKFNINVNSNAAPANNTVNGNNVSPSASVITSATVEPIHEEHKEEIELNHNNNDKTEHQSNIDNVTDDMNKLTVEQAESKETENDSNNDIVQA